ncbi:hypothetical protein Clacol_003231 [Clathrus columnatus]|uniref:Oxysterol-binding protein n=1 Tax=Clathrus columnatus TaxID=1419009 RepID=A0AAV5AAP9_9AGAM|nr:hypothetical protein Clacol_003231 [Clathrus columnatus]
MATATEPLYQVKLLAALRSGDPALIQPLLTEIGRDRGKAVDDAIDLGAAALHLAIRCVSCAFSKISSVQKLTELSLDDTINLLLQHRSISPNAIHPPESKVSALHLAASLGRVDVVSLLLDQPGINDTLRDNKGLTARDVARTKEVRDVIQGPTYILSPPSASPPLALVEMLSSPRASLLDLSYLDDASGFSLLHEAARRKDIRLVELAVTAGADVFVRDRKGKSVIDAGGKDDRVKAYLRQFTNQDRTLIEPSPSEPPTLKGYLNKYTNVARDYRHQDDENVNCRGSISMTCATLKFANSERVRFEVHSAPSQRNDPRAPYTSTSGSGVQKWYIKANHQAEAARWVQAIKKHIEWYHHQPTPVPVSLSLPYDPSRTNSSSDASSLRARSKSEKHSRHESRGSSIEDREERNGKGYTDDETRSLAHSSSSSSGANPPYNDSIELQGNTAIAQLEVTTKLLSTISSPSSSPPNKRFSTAETALKESLSQAQQVVTDYVRMVKEREQWFRDTLKKERDRAAMWEESLSVVVKEGAMLEDEIRKRERARSARRRSLLLNGEGGSMTLRQKPTRDLPALPDIADAISSMSSPPTSPLIAIANLEQAPTAESRTVPPVVVTSSLSLMAERVALDSEEDESDEDEFFDAIESNNLPNLVVSVTLQAQPSPLTSIPLELQPYIGYQHLRNSLPIKSDDRPSTSLWQVLKSSIGKDLTKITFPVYFNEPTSMLQRMAEDMEFSECLDAAVVETDPHKRLAFVAAFAMSNYSSTIGRIAKPFNPMLGETFEYVRLDKHYRYYSEQVSHHPPISACWAEGQNWRYYGEVDAQNKFMGKSFEIRPTGVAHADVKLNEDPNDDRYEHYTWKKVTTCVSGFILGNTTIDHYGEMEIINHRTKDKCVLTFKPRGWRGKDAFEISGHVLDQFGCVTYDIAGRWDSQLIARRAGTGRGVLLPTVDIDEPRSPSEAEYVLLWKNTEKPKAPFNLTPFAITLNDCPDTLRPYLPYTDCRLRPDQRAFELGKYELANQYKGMQEEYQRATRRKREQGILPPHSPRWFEAKTDGDTGERVWSPLKVKGQVQYWTEREKVFFGNKSSEDKWPNVDRIFIDEKP